MGHEHEPKAWAGMIKQMLKCMIEQQKQLIQYERQQV